MGANDAIDQTGGGAEKKLTILNGRLRVAGCGGALVLSPKPGTDSPCCCDNCKQCYCFVSNGVNDDGVDCAGTSPGDKAFKKTITVPQRFSLPVKVTAVGGVDDVFVLDGDPTVFGQNPAPFGTPAHSFSYEWVQENRTFTVEALDTYGACLSMSYTICIMPLDTDPAEECEPTIVLEGSKNGTCTGASA